LLGVLDRAMIRRVGTFTFMISTYVAAETYCLILSEISRYYSWCIYETWLLRFCYLLMRYY